VTVGGPLRGEASVSYRPTTAGRAVWGSTAVN
jgi:hypothetical protein